MKKTTKNIKLTPRFFFISLGVLVTLITSVSSFLILLFESLNKKFPDVLNASYTYGYNSYNFESIRAALATLIIFFPIFLILAYFWRKISKTNLSRNDNIIFKWLIYLVIFLSSLVIAIDLVTLVRYFVSGEITTRFILKVLGALVVSIIVGFNYFSELKNHESKKENKTSLVCSMVSIVLFFGLIVWSFSIMGSPKEQRAWRIDEQRINNLSSIQSQVINYWQQKEKLPASLDNLSNPISGYTLPVDPEFEKGRNYDYKPTGDLSFQLCATFDAQIPKGWQENNYGRIMPLGNVATDMAVSSSSPSPDYPYWINNSWDHGEGYTCFERTIDPDIYTPFNKN